MFFIQTNIGIIIKYISIVYILPIQYQPPLKECVKYQCLNIDNTLSNLSVFSLLVFTSDSLSSTTVESSDVFSAISLMPSAVSDAVIFRVLYHC